MLKKYAWFGLMIATSTVLMFVLMYLNTYELGHLQWSETRAWMALLMGASMALVMLGFMRHMYTSRAANLGIAIAAVAVFVVSLYLVRSQRTIDQVDWMKAMVPHHSIAILTSERAELSDPRVQELARGIIEAQRREIGEMKTLIRELENPRTDAAAARP